MYLDKEEYEKAERQLKKAICVAKENNKDYELVTIQCCYGDLLYRLGRIEEATIYLDKVVSYYEETYEHKYEYDIAKEILDHINNEKK